MTIARAAGTTEHGQPVRTHRVNRRKHGEFDGQVLRKPPLGVQVDEGRGYLSVKRHIPATNHQVRVILVVVGDRHVERARPRDLAKPPAESRAFGVGASECARVSDLTAQVRYSYMLLYCLQ